MTLCVNFGWETLFQQIYLIIHLPPYMVDKNKIDKVVLSTKHDNYTYLLYFQRANETARKGNIR